MAEKNEPDKHLKQNVLSFLLNPMIHADKVSVLESYRHANPEEALLPKWFNGFFLSDRIIDVYLRKNSFDEVFALQLSKWRYVLAYLFVALDEGEESPDNFLALLRTFDSFAIDYVGFSENLPKSSAVLDSLNKLNLKLFVPEVVNNEFQEQVFKEVKDSHEKGVQRRQKLLNRLIESEQGAARITFANAAASDLINSLLTGKSLPESVIEFVDRYWGEIIKQKLLTEKLDKVPESISTITKDMYAIFSSSLSQHPETRQEKAISLVDRIEAILPSELKKSHDIHECMSLMQKDVIAVLQSKEVELNQFNYGVGQSSEFLEPQKLRECKKFVSRWVNDVEKNARYMLTYWEPLSGQYLITNMYGAKAGHIDYSHFQKGMLNNTLKLIESYVSLEGVIEDTVKGLSKVVGAQLQQRRAAIEKVKKEAEALRQAQLKAEAEEKERQRLAKEEADRLAKLAEEKRLAQEAERRQLLFLETCNQLDVLKLGAWMEYTRNGSVQKGKLAVKTKATQKLIFVDKLGLNRFEINLQELANQVIDNKARILDTGAEFDDSLQRTVSRIRMAAK